MNEEFLYNRGRFIFSNGKYVQGKELFRCNNVDEARTFVKVVNMYINEIQSKI